MVVVTDFTATQAGEVGFRTVGAGAIRMIFAGLSERATAGSRKCCPMKDPRKKTLSGIISEIGKKYKVNQAAGEAVYDTVAERHP